MSLVLVVLIFVFIIIDFSNNSDNFTDRGAELSEIWGDYYLNYIPEMIRLMLPMAVFIAVLLTAGQMAERLEITAIKAAGVSLYRFMLPFLLYAFVMTAFVSFLDAFVVPKSNAERIAFERQYLMTRSDRVERSRIYRQESPNTVLTVNYYDSVRDLAYQVKMYRFDGDQIEKMADIARMEWDHEKLRWKLTRGEYRFFNENGYHKISFTESDTTLNILPRDLARSASDIDLLTYPEIIDYINSLKRSGAAGIEAQQVQFYIKLFYPLGTLIITIIGIAIASERRRGGKGMILGTGVAISFLYVASMYIIEPFGAAGAIDPMLTAAIPHILFFLVSLILLYRTPK